MSRTIDVREYPEFAEAHVEGSELVPLGTIGKVSEAWDRTQPLTLVCRTGRRAEQAKQLLQAKGFSAVAVLAGGIVSWQQAGKPIVAAEHKPWSMERQVRVTAGSLVLGFVVLGTAASRRFFLGAGLIGAGLIYAGASDNCMMASLLGRLPWNRPERGKRMTPAAIAGGLLLGVFIGAISGLVGIGGGAFLIPALTMFYGLSQKRAQGTSVATLLLPIGAMAFWEYWKAGQVDLRLALLIAIGFVAGGWAGGAWAQHLSELLLRRVFAVFLVLLAAKMAFSR